MEVRAGRVAGGADEADPLAGAHDQRLPRGRDRGTRGGSRPTRARPGSGGRSRCRSGRRRRPRARSRPRARRTARRAAPRCRRRGSRGGGGRRRRRRGRRRPGRRSRPLVVGIRRTPAAAGANDADAALLWAVSSAACACASSARSRSASAVAAASSSPAWNASFSREHAVGEELLEVLGGGGEALRLRRRLGLGRLGGVELLRQRGHLLLRLLEGERHPVEREDDVGARDVAAEHGGELEDVVDVPLGVVVGEDRAGDVGAAVRRGEVAGGRVDRVVGVPRVGDPVAVPVHAPAQPGVGHELHPADGSGRARAHVAAEVRLDLVDRGEHLPRDPVRRRRRGARAAAAPRRRARGRAGTPTPRLRAAAGSSRSGSAPRRSGARRGRLRDGRRTGRARPRTCPRTRCRRPARGRAATPR